MFGKKKRTQEPNHPVRAVAWGCEPHIARLVQLNLERQGGLCVICDTEDEAMRLVVEFRANMLIVDPDAVPIRTDDIQKRLSADPATAHVKVLPLGTPSFVYPSGPSIPPGPTAAATVPASLAEYFNRSDSNS